jgi:hypothetical protein
MSFDPRLICRALNDAGVQYVVVGGFAAVVHGSPLPTSDVDLVPERGEDNLDRLSGALQAIGAKLRTADGPVDAPIDAAFLAAMPFMLNLTTDHGDLDLTFEPAGPLRGYDDWNRDAKDVEIAPGLVIRVASLDAVIGSKRAAGRPKDERALPYLESLRDQVRRQPG